MKTHIKTYLITFGLYLLLVTSCTPTPDNIVTSLAQAGKCMESYPDSALNILNRIPNPEILHGKAQADYCLLMTQAMHKNDIKFTSDSLISIAVGYYDAHPMNTATTGKSFFYYGKVMQDIDSTELAMRYYLKAKDVLDETKEYKMLGLIAESMGDLNRKQKLFDASLDNYRLSFRYFNMIPDSLSISYAYRNIARAFIWKKEVDSAFQYYNSALHISESHKLASESSILLELGIVYRSEGDYSKAEYYFLSSVHKEKDYEQIFSDYLSLGYLYEQMGQLSDARKYLNLCLASKKLVIQRDAFECLYHLERKQNNLIQAVLYKDKADSLLELTHNSETQEMIAKLQKKYDNERLQKENLQMSIKNKNLLLMGSIIFFMAILIIIYFYNKNRANRRQIKYIQQQLQEKEVAITFFEHELEEFKQREGISENYKNKIGELNGKILLLNQQKKALNVHLEQLGGTALKVDTRTEEYMAAFRVLLSLKNIDSKGDKNAEINWQRLYDLCDFLSMNFVTRIDKQYPKLTKHSLEICCLLRLGLTNEELSRVFITASDSVTKAKSRAKKGLFLSAEDDLDSFIRKY